MYFTSRAGLFGLVLAGASLPPPSWWISPFVGAALWPFLFLLLDDLRARLRIQ